jgi:hypothetical protein
MRATGLVLLSLTVAACATARPASRDETRAMTEARVEVGTVTTDVAVDGNAISKAIALGPRAVELRATSDTVRLRVGEVLTIPALPLTMIDSRGASLGPLPLYDVQVERGGFVSMTEAGIRGVRPGVQTVSFAIPRPFRGRREGPAPRAVIHFAVRE